MQFGEGKVGKCLKTPKGLNVKTLFNPFRVVEKPHISFSELHSELFMFNPFGILELVGNGQSFKLASSY